MQEINVNNYEDIMYELICEYCKKDVSVNTFLEAVGDIFRLPTHKWSVFPADNAPEGDVSEYTVWTNNGYEIFDITLNCYDNLGHADCIYETLKVELNL